MYNYNDGKSRVQQILDNDTEIEERLGIPSNKSEFTYNNGIKAWTSAIFVDIRNSSKMMTDEDPKKLAKILKSFVSEITEILNLEKQLVRELGIRGDCVYGIYSTKSKSEEYKVYKLTWMINTCIKMLNKMLKKNNYQTIKVGIGFSCAYEFIVKAGRKGTGENDRIWIGDSIHKASNLSSIMNKDFDYPIGFHSGDLDYFKSELKKEYPKMNVDSWFHEFWYNGDKYYGCNLIDPDFNEWVKNEC